MRYTPEIEKEIDFLTERIEEDEALCAYFPARWLAIQLLEGDLNLLNGKVQPNPRIIGMNDFPCRPTLLINRSMTKAARAM